MDRHHGQLLLPRPAYSLPGWPGPNTEGERPYDNGAAGSSERGRPGVRESASKCPAVRNRKDRPSCCFSAKFELIDAFGQIALRVQSPPSFDDGGDFFAR